MKIAKNRRIFDCIKVDNALVFTDWSHSQLISCNSNGTDIRHIPLSYKPCYMTAVDSSTVAVSCSHDRCILIVDISIGSVISTIKTSGKCYGVSYDGNNLYAVIGRDKIHVIDLTDKVIIRTIHLPSKSTIDITVHRDRLVWIYMTSVHCRSLDGRLMWKFKNHKYENLCRVTTDNEGNVYVTDCFTSTVVVLSDDGKQYRECLTESDGLDTPHGIYFDKKENMLLACNLNDGNAFLIGVKKKHS